MVTFKEFSIFISIGCLSLLVFDGRLTTPFIVGQNHRKTSTYLGNGACKWTPPNYDTPQDEVFQKTLLAGYPGGEKRLTYALMEALTGLAARDEWDFEYFDFSNEPFIKANYPHHEGSWGWESHANSVVLVIRNIRSAMIEYHEILWDLDYAETFMDSRVRMPHLYQDRPETSDFNAWRDDIVMDEISWYGWFIDYWMEGGLLRDIYTHRTTTRAHWDMLMIPTAYSREDVDYDLIVGEAIVTPAYDPHCVNDVSDGCEPVEIISAERLLQPDTGPSENRKVAQHLLNQTGVKDHMIPEDAWECIWTEVMLNRKGPETFVEREQIGARNFNFSEEMLRAMLDELNRLITKYSEPEWSGKYTAQELVAILDEDRVLLQNELDDVLAGGRRLKNNDFLGPETRKKLAEKQEEENLYW